MYVCMYINQLCSIILSVELLKTKYIYQTSVIEMIIL